jgi:hypothetical protein
VPFNGAHSDDVIDGGRHHSLPDTLSPGMVDRYAEVFPPSPVVSPLGKTALLADFRYGLARSKEYVRFTRFEN